MSEENIENNENNWLDSLPEGIRASTFFRDGEGGAKKTADQVLADLNNASQWMGNSLRIPGPDTSDEDKAKFTKKAIDHLPNMMPVPDPDSDGYADVFAKMGKPEDADKYVSPDETGISPEEMGQLKSIALKANLTQRQFKDYISDLSSARKEAFDVAQTVHTEDISGLKGEWGATYGQRMEEIGQYIKNDKAMPANLKALHDNGQMDADTYRWMYVQSQLGDESSEVQGQQGRAATPTPLEAQEQFDELTVRLLKMSPSDPKYKMLSDKRVEMMGYIHGIDNVA